MSSYTAPPPTITEFASVMSEETGWYIFGTFMGVPANELDNIGLNYRTEGVMRCLIEMYKCIESRGLPLSWEHIVDSLRKMNNYSLADKIHSKYILSSLRLSPTSDQGCNVVISPNTDSTPKNGEQHSAQVCDDQDDDTDSSTGTEVIGVIASYFVSLSEKFTSLAAKIKITFKQTSVDIDHLQDLIKGQCGLEPLPEEKATIDAVFGRLHQHYSILNFRVLAFLVEELLKKHQSLRKKITDYEDQVDQFKSCAKMIELVDLIKAKQITTDKHKTVKLKVRQFWTNFTVKQFENIMNRILKTLYKLASQISVKEGCICVSWVVPDLDIADLITPQPMDFLKIIGVISLHVGDILVYDVPGEGPDTLKAAMLQSVHLKNRRAIELLLSVGADPQLLTTSENNEIKNISFTSDSDETPYTEENVCEEVDFIEKEEEMARVSDSGDFGLEEHSSSKDDPNETDTVEEQGNDKETNTVLKQHLDEEEPQILSTTLPERLYQKEEAKTEEETRVDQRDETEEGTRVDHDQREAETEEGTRVDQREGETEEGTRVDQREDETEEETRVDQREGETEEETRVDQREDETEEGTRVDQRESETKEETRVDQRKAEKQANESLRDNLTMYLQFKQVEDVVRADLTISEPSLMLEDHDIKIQILKKYWSQDSSKVLSCCLAAGLKNRGQNSGFILISPVFHLSCDSEQPVDFLLTVPHSLVTPSEDQLKKMAIFTLSGSKLSSYTSFLKFNNLQTPHLTVEEHYAMFITTLHKSSYFVMGLASSTADVSPLSPLPVFPLQCSLYMEYPADLNDYITGTLIDVYITLNLKTVELYMKGLGTKDRKVERVNFILSEPKATVDSNNSLPDWLSLRKGDGVCQYTDIAYGGYSYSHRFPTTTYFVQCLNPKEPLKFRVTVTSGGYELADLLITPFNPLSKADLTRTLVPADESPNRLALNSTQEKPEILEDNEDNKKQSSSELMEKDYKSKMGISKYNFSNDDLTRNSSSLVHEHYPGIKMEITSNYWSQYPSDEVFCQLDVPDELDCIWPSGYIFISPATYLMCETERPVDVKITLPHPLATSIENHSVRIEIFASTVSFVRDNFGTSYYSIQQFIPVKKSDLTMDDEKISFTTTVSGPSLYVVGVPSSIVGVASTPLPVVPLQCVVSVYCSDDLNKYLRGDYIIVSISMDLRRKEIGTGRRRESRFTLPGPVFSINGTVETSSSSGWRSVRAGKRSFHYDEIAFSEKWNKKRCNNIPIVWTSFFVKCFDPKTSLNFRVTVLCHNNNELVNLLLTPFH